MTTHGPTAADRKRLQRYLRLLLSYGDFKHAFRGAEYLLSEHETCAAHSGDDLRLRALYCSLVVAYARPFNSSGTSRSGRVPPLDSAFRTTLSAEEGSLHDYLLLCRNKLVAHSDAEVADPLPYVATDLGGEVVVPLRNDSLAPFTADVSAAVRDLARKALDWSVSARRRLEPEILHLLERRPFQLTDQPHQVGT